MLLPGLVLWPLFSVGQRGCSIIFIHSPARSRPALSKKEGQTVCPRGKGFNALSSPTSLHPQTNIISLGSDLELWHFPCWDPKSCAHQAHSRIFKLPDSLVYDTLSNPLTHALVIFPSAQFSLHWLMCRIIQTRVLHNVTLSIHKCFLTCVMGLFLGQHGLDMFSNTVWDIKAVGLLNMEGK